MAKSLSQIVDELKKLNRNCLKREINNQEDILLTFFNDFGSNE
jgi:hypothetical protein